MLFGKGTLLGAALTVAELKFNGIREFPRIQAPVSWFCHFLQRDFPHGLFMVNMTFIGQSALATYVYKKRVFRYNSQWGTHLLMAFWWWRGRLVTPQYPVLQPLQCKLEGKNIKAQFFCICQTVWALSWDKIFCAIKYTDNISRNQQLHLYVSLRKKSIQGLLC